MSSGTTIITAIVGSTAVASLVQFFVSRHDSRADKIDKIAADLSKLREELGEGRAISARIRILVAADEVVRGERHSQEWWDQVLDDCTFYDQYCLEHKDFKNKKAQHAVKVLNDVYFQVFKNNDFI